MAVKKCNFKIGEGIEKYSMIFISPIKMAKNALIFLKIGSPKRRTVVMARQKRTSRALKRARERAEHLQSIDA
jgi:hypothetical protein